MKEHVTTSENEEMKKRKDNETEIERPPGQANLRSLCPSTRTSTAVSTAGFSFFFNFPSLILHFIVVVVVSSVGKRFRLRSHGRFSFWFWFFFAIGHRSTCRVHRRRRRFLAFLRACVCVCVCVCVRRLITFRKPSISDATPEGKRKHQNHKRTPFPAESIITHTSFYASLRCPLRRNWLPGARGHCSTLSFFLSFITGFG